MSIGDIITYIMLFFALIGAADRAIGCKFGPGKSFEKGFEATGALILAMVGPIALAPMISKYLAPVLSPVCEAVGIDPSIIAGLFLANDSGGWPLALALAQDELIGKFSGSLVGSVMGCCIMFAFPMSFALTKKEKRPLVAKGLTIGLITIPFTCFVGGLCFGINIVTLIINLLPLIIFAGIFIIGLKFFEKLTVKVVTVFGYVITAILTVALAAAMIIKIMKLDVPDFGTFDEAMLIIGGIAVFLCGAFTLLYFLQKFFGKSFDKLGKKLGMDEQSVVGLLTTSVNAIPMFGMTDNMNDRGIVVNVAYLVPASFIIGDHLAFQAAVDTTVIVPFIIGKLAGGILAIVLAMMMTRPKKENA